MRFSIPGVPGAYYDTDAESTAITAALTAASRRAPTPHRYGLQALPHLWSIDVDLTEVPGDHPLQYLHPEGARSVEELTREGRGPNVGRQAELALQFAWAANQSAELNAEHLFGRRDRNEARDLDGVTIEIEDDEGARFGARNEAARDGSRIESEGIEGEGNEDEGGEDEGFEPRDDRDAQSDEDGGRDGNRFDDGVGEADRFDLDGEE